MTSLGVLAVLGHTIGVSEPDGVREATVLNQELTTLLVGVGRRMGWSVRTEYAVPGGRLDVVWVWEPALPMPGLEDPVAVAGFEIESSWRTRKHVKGDLLNIQDAGVALGVIVLAGADPRDQSLRRFAASLVERPGPRVLVWTEADVRALAAGEPHQDSLTLTAAVSAGARPAPIGAPTLTPASPETGAIANHVGKYRPLWDWLRHQEPREISVAFKDIEEILGFPLPDSCRDHVAHWHSYQGSAVARAIIDAGWHASRVRLTSNNVTLSPGPPPGRR